MDEARSVIRVSPSTSLSLIVRRIVDDGIPIELRRALSRRRLAGVLKSLHKVRITIPQSSTSLKNEILREVVKLKIEPVEPSYLFQLFGTQRGHHSRTEGCVVLLEIHCETYTKSFLERVLSNLIMRKKSIELASRLIVFAKSIATRLRLVFDYRDE